MWTTVSIARVRKSYCVRGREGVGEDGGGGVRAGHASVPVTPVQSLEPCKETVPSVHKCVVGVVIEVGELGTLRSRGGSDGGGSLP